MVNKVRIEIHMTEDEVRSLDELASSVGRSRKNFCESVIKKLVVAHDIKNKVKSVKTKK